MWTPKVEAHNPRARLTQHLPNLLSASRIPAALLLLAVYRPDDPSRAWSSVGLVLLIMATDLLDGRLARRYGVASQFGYLLDGLGDRAVHVVAYLLLLNAEVLSALVAWALIFREISQYGVRLVEPAWHTSQTPTDRIVTRIYTFVVHCTLLTELVRTAVGQDTPTSPYVLIVNVTLCAVVIASYSKILPRLFRAWKESTSD